MIVEIKIHTKIHPKVMLMDEISQNQDRKMTEIKTRKRKSRTFPWKTLLKSFRKS